MHKIVRETDAGTTTLTVLHTCPIWLPLTQTWLFNQLRALPAGIKMLVCSMARESPARFPCEGLQSMCGSSWIAYKVETALRRLGIPMYPYWLAYFTNSDGAGILHSHFGNMGWFDLRAARRLRIPHVVTFYGLDVHFLPKQDPRWLARYKKMFSHVDAILCEGPHMASCIEASGCPPGKVRVHHLGVDLESIPYQPRTRKSGEPLRVLIAGAFREKKGISYALRALGKLQRDVALEITVIGDADEEARSQVEKRRILGIIEKYQLGSRIRMLGFQSHADFFREAYRHHIFLSPSVHAEDGDTEGGAPVSIIEMAASGMPVVSTFHCDIPEVIKDGVSGLLVPERDVDALVERLRWLADHHDEWGRFALAARRHIETEFNMNVQGRRLAALYREIVAAHE